MTIYSLALDAREGKATGEPQRVIQTGASEQFPTVTSDGRKMVFVSRKLGTPDIWMKDLVIGEESVVVATPEEERRGLISPDGSRLAFQRIENQRAVNYLFPLPRGPETKFCEGCRSLLGFSPDGKSLLVSEGEPEHIVLFEIDTGHKIVPAVHPKYPIHDGRLSPDSRWYAFKLVLSAQRQPVYITPVRDGGPAGEQEWIQIAEGPTTSRSGRQTGKCFTTTHQKTARTASTPGAWIRRRSAQLARNSPSAIFMATSSRQAGPTSAMD